MCQLLYVNDKPTAKPQLVINSGHVCILNNQFVHKSFLHARNIFPTYLTYVAMTLELQQYKEGYSNSLGPGEFSTPALDFPPVLEKCL